MQNIINVPNSITMIRGIVGIIGIIIATYPDTFLVGVLIFAIGGMLPDLADGHFARKLNQCTKLGEFLDPFVDKILFYGALFSVFLEYIWMPVLGAMLICDIISTILHFTKPCGAVKSGKEKFMWQCISLGMFCAGILIDNSFIAFANLAMVAATYHAIQSLKQRFND